MEKLYVMLCENDSSNVNYNKNGTQDSKGLIPVSELYIDNFLLSITLEENLVDKNRHVYKENGKTLSNIWKILKAAGLTKSKPKTLVLNKSAAGYCQVYKVHCAEEEVSTVMNFLEKPAMLGEFGLHLQEIDAAVDVAGTFDKREIENYLMETGFRMEGDSNATLSKTIIDNDVFVGKNCLSYMDGGNRFKLFNKFVQSMETNAVRNRVGNHIYDWVVQQGTKLANARDMGIDRGVTQAEVTFYTSEAPTLEVMKERVFELLGHIPNSLVY